MSNVRPFFFDCIRMFRRLKWLAKHRTQQKLLSMNRFEKKLCQLPATSCLLLASSRPGDGLNLISAIDSAKVTRSEATILSIGGSDSQPADLNDSTRVLFAVDAESGGSLLD